MKKIFVFILMLFICSVTHAHSYKQVVVFGDSLSDNGNLYNGLFKLMPKSPPYYDGRFTNGYTWADIVANAYATKYHSECVNYAVGGASVVLRNPFEGFLPWDLCEEINNYLIKYLFKDKSETLFIIWMGAIDYFNGQKDVERSTNEVIHELTDQINRLISNGGRHFLILNVPDLSHTPFGVTCDYAENLHILSLIHNTKLILALDTIRHQHKEIQITHIDTLQILDEILANPEKYNKKYNKQLKHLLESCWKGGYTLNNTNIDYSKMLAYELSYTVPNLNSQRLSQHLLNSRSTAEAYAVSKWYENGLTPCEKPEEYVFWDKVHPSAAVHQILAAVALEQLEDKAELTLQI